MLTIDIRKLELPRTVDVERCEDESGRIIRYTKPEPPKEYATMQQIQSYYGDGTVYKLSVHLPPLRKVDIVVTVAHTSVNCWKVTASTRYSSDILTFKTLNEVTESFKRIFGE